MVDDSTMRMQTHADSTFTRIVDSTRFELRGGRLSAVPMRGTVRYVIRMVPDSTFWSGSETIYARVSNDLWRALFPMRGADGTPRYYELRRMRR